MESPMAGARICKDGQTESNCRQYRQSNNLYILANGVQLLPINGHHEIPRPHITDTSAYEHGATSVRELGIDWEHLSSEREYSKIGRQSTTAVNRRTLLDFLLGSMT